MDKNGDMTINFKEWQDFFSLSSDLNKSVVSVKVNSRREEFS
jgi:hypothetical protein